jgi:dihydrofolate reductase
MGRFIFGMMQSLDGYIAGPSGGPQSGGVLSSQAAAELPPPGPNLARHFNDFVRGANGFLYGRRMYEVMRYWDEDQPDWDEGDHDFAQAWRSKPKWVASRSLTSSVGPNATRVQGDLIDFAAKLKSERDGEIDVAGAELANVLSAAGLVDEYRLYFRPYVLGGGKPYFAGPLPPLRLVKHEAIGEDAVRLTCVPA